MSKKVWIIFGVSVLVLALAAGGAVFYYFQWKERVIQDARERGNQHFADELWRPAKKSYYYYLAHYPDDLDVLKKYAKASEKLVANRPKMLQDAAVAYAKIATEDPNNIEAMEKVLSLNRERRAWSDVEFYADTFLAHHPDREDFSFQKALALDRMGQWDEAITAYRDLIDQGTEQFEVYGNLARLLQQQGMDAQAEALFEEALESNPEAGEIWVERAQFRLNTGVGGGASTAIEQALKFAPESPKAWVVASHVAMAGKEWELCEKRAQKAIELQPGMEDAYLALIVAYERLEEYDTAIELIKNIDPYVKASRPEFLLGLAELSILTERYDAAREAKAELNKIFPNQRSLDEYLEARLLLAEGNAAKAATKLTTVVENRPDFRQAQYYLIAAHLGENDRRAARTRLEFYIRNYPQDEEARELFEREFGGTQSLARVREASDELLERENADAQELVDSARILFTRQTSRASFEENSEVVVKLLDKAIERDPALASSYLMLCEVYLYMDQPEDAQETIERARQAQIESSQLELVQAGVELAQDRDDDAIKRFKSFFDSDSLDLDETIRWAEFFDQHGGAELGQAVLDHAISLAPGDDVLTLQLSKVSLFKHANNFEEAAKVLSAVESQERLAPESRMAVRNEKKELIRSALDNGDNDSLDVARRVSTDLLELQPGDLETQLLRARVLRATTPPDLDGAAAMAESVLNSDPNSVEALRLLSDIALERGDTADALEYASRSATLAPNDADAQRFLGEIQLKTNRYREAQVTLERALDVDPNSRRTMELIIEAYRQTGRTDQALAMIDRLEESFDGASAAQSGIQVLRARLQLEKGANLAAAEETLRAHYEANPDSLRAALDLAQALARQGRREEGMKILRSFAERTDDKPQAWVSLARYQMSNPAPNHLTEASASLTRALVYDRNYAPALRNLIELNVRADNGADVFGLIERYLELRPDDHEVVYQRALLLANKPGRRAEAMETVERAIELEPDSDYLFLRARLNLLQNQYDKALADLQTVMNDFQATPANLDLALAEAYLGTNQEDMGVQYYKLAKTKISDGQQVDPSALERVEKLVPSEEALNE